MRVQNALVGPRLDTRFNPGIIADNVGDDAGMGADLLKTKSFSEVNS